MQRYSGFAETSLSHHMYRNVNRNYEYCTLLKDAMLLNIERVRQKNLFYNSAKEILDKLVINKFLSTHQADAFSGKFRGDRPYVQRRHSTNDFCYMLRECIGMQKEKDVIRLNLHLMRVCALWGHSLRRILGRNMRHMTRKVSIGGEYRSTGANRVRIAPMEKKI